MSGVLQSFDLPLDESPSSQTQAGSNRILRFAKKRELAQVEPLFGKLWEQHMPTDVAVNTIPPTWWRRKMTKSCSQAMCCMISAALEGTLPLCRKNTVLHSSYHVLPWGKRFQGSWWHHDVIPLHSRIERRAKSREKSKHLPLEQD